MDNKQDIENQEVEVWRKVVGFEDKYEVSSLGNIISNNWNRTGQRRPVKVYLNRKTGYMYTLL